MGSSAFGQTKQVTLKPGESMEVGKYSLAYNNLSYEPVPGKMVFTAQMSVKKNSQTFTEVAPVKYFDQALTER